MPNRLTKPTWASWPTRAVLAVLAAIVATSAFPIGSVAPVLSVAAQEDVPASGEEVIVVLEEGADPVAVADELGVEPTHVYEDIFTGFSVTTPAEAVAEASASDEVRQISPDGRVQAEDQTVGTGVRRVGVPLKPGSQNLDIASPIDADIAILDTGITSSGDLNVRGGKSCIDEKQKKEKKPKKDKKDKKDKRDKNNGNNGKNSIIKNKDGKERNKSIVRNKREKFDNDRTNNKKSSDSKKNKKGSDNKKNKGSKDRSKRKSWKDDNGHGTHVAGIAAALDNNQGVVGVAPGARVWAVKVLDANGSGSFSDVICGLNWVVQARGMIDVVNLSLSGAGSEGASCASSALHRAVCNVVDAGIPVVVAAGNQGKDAGTRVPASFDEVITVSAMADSNGEPGGGPKTCFGEADDTFLSFSNFGADVDIAAPGNCIISLWPGGNLQRQSGTSSASPHVAEAVARYVASDPGTRPTAEEVRDWLRDEASKPQDDPDFGFSGDNDGHPEPMLWLREALGD